MIEPLEATIDARLDVPRCEVFDVARSRAGVAPQFGAEEVRDVLTVRSQYELRAAIGALIGGFLWALKSVSILVADYQPDFTFEVAPLFFSLAALGVAAKVDSRRKARAVLIALAVLSFLTGALAVIAHVFTGDDGAFGPLLMLSVLSLLAVLGYGGWLVRHWSMTPVAIFVISLVALPVGGVLSEVEERLLEVPLLIVSAAWISLGLTFWAEARKAPIGLASA